ncbi:uncharacterized protein [Rutidosis leptorrhynchoides]|uniref:uncharacterized protein n=1 Tax=Rutidosis leptorrhynchoides TaxID=125765 RepID=UPI003A9A14B5
MGPQLVENETIDMVRGDLDGAIIDDDTLVAVTDKNQIDPDQGRICYFDGRHIDYGLECLKRASNSQLTEAVYVYGLIMFASCKIEEKHVGLQILNETFPPEPEMVVAVRTRVFDLLRCLWLFNRLPFADVAMSYPISDHCGYFPHIHGFELTIPECMSCFWAYELGVFVNQFAYN